MCAAFKELHRILKKDGQATVIFHSSSSGLWNALNRAYSDAGLQLAATSVLDKTQGSFKQVTTAGAVKGDPVLLLTKGLSKTKLAVEPVERVLDNLLHRARASVDRTETSAQRLYSRFVTHYLSQKQDIPLDADQFYRQIKMRVTNSRRQRDDVRRAAD
jgi:hypothetical protein